MPDTALTQPLDRQHATAALSLEESESRYRKLIEAAFFGVVISVDGTISDVTPALARIFGYEREDLLGRPVLDLIADESHELVRGKVTANIEGSYECMGRRKDGRRVHIEVTARRHEVGGRVGRLTAVRDITEKKDLEQRLRHAQKLEAVGRLAGGVAHDFNNVLTVVQSYTEMLRADFPEQDPRTADVDEIIDAVKRARGLTRQLLAFSRQQVLKPAVLSLNDVIRGVDRMLRRLVGEHIELVLAPGAAVNVRADAGQLEQVLMNLAVNASDAMPGGGRLTIATRTVDADTALAASFGLPGVGRYAVISVTDTGTGMTPEVAARMFEPFFTTKEAGRGTGLGLATTYGIVSQSGGQIRVTTAPGEGSCFCIFLPAVAEPAAAADRIREAAPPRGTETVLIAEDDPAVRAVTAEILVRQGYTVILARSGNEALMRAEAHHDYISLLITDVVMPGMDGATLVRQLAGKHPRIRALFMSGYTGDPITQLGVSESGVPLLEKPFTAAELSRKVRDVLDAV